MIVLEQVKIPGSAPVGVYRRGSLHFPITGYVRLHIRPSSEDPIRREYKRKGKADPVVYPRRVSAQGE